MNRYFTFIFMVIWLFGATYYIYVKTMTEQKNHSTLNSDASGRAQSVDADLSKNKVTDEKLLNELHASLTQAKSEQDREHAATNLLHELYSLDKAAITPSIRKDIVKTLPGLSEEEASYLLLLFTSKGDQEAIPLLIDVCILINNQRVRGATLLSAYVIGNNIALNYAKKMATKNPAYSSILTALEHPGENQ